MKISWVHTYTEKNVPKNGLAIYNNQKVWFDKVPDYDDEYYIMELDSETIESLEKEHHEYCEISGEPFYYGEPKYHKKIKNLERNAPEGEYSGYYSPLMQVSKMTFKIIPERLSGDILKIFKKEEFENYYVARKVIF